MERLALCASAHTRKHQEEAVPAGSRLGIPAPPRSRLPLAGSLPRVPP